MKRLAIQIRGRQHSWSFPFYGDPKYLDVWRSDGLDVIVIENTIPAWVVELGLARPWCAIQDFFK